MMQDEIKKIMAPLTNPAQKEVEEALQKATEIIVGFCAHIMQQSARNKSIIAETSKVLATPKSSKLRAVGVEKGLEKAQKELIKINQSHLDVLKAAGAFAALVELPKDSKSPKGEERGKADKTTLFD